MGIPCSSKSMQMEECGLVSEGVPTDVKMNSLASFVTTFMVSSQYYYFSNTRGLLDGNADM
jgi:hypothetical protein